MEQFFFFFFFFLIFETPKYANIVLIYANLIAQNSQTELNYTSYNKKYYAKPITA